MLFKSRKCNGLPVVSPELAQIDELQNSSALTPKWSERGSSDTGVRISSNSLYWLSVRQGDIIASPGTQYKRIGNAHTFAAAVYVFNCCLLSSICEISTHDSELGKCIGLCIPGEANSFLVCMFCFRFQFNWIQQHHWSTHSDWKLTQCPKWTPVYKISF